MKTRYRATPKFIANLVVACLLTNVATTKAMASLANQDQLTPGEILNLAARHYAALASYSDEGRIVSTIDGMTSTTSFLTKLARPGRFLVEWQRTRTTSTTALSSSVKEVFSTGAGDYLETGLGAEDEGSPDIALDLASSYSSGASVTIPMTFFKMPTGDELAGTGFGETRQPDEKVGFVECFVLTGKSQNLTRTLWIGREDFLIHQVRTVASAQEMRDDMAKVTNESPESTTLLQRWTSTETITNIVLNPVFLRSDFAPAVQHFANTFDE